jgi:hypothetical protein
MTPLPFGWLPFHIDEGGAGWHVRSAPGIQGAIAEVRNSGRLDSEWYWPPITSGLPHRAEGRFTLPSTHEILIDNPSSASEAERAAEFLVVTLGFLYGMSLIPEGWMHLNRVSIAPRRWQDFYVAPAARVRVLTSALRVWESSPQIREHLFGALWWHSYSISYEHAFDIFAAQYQILDCCWFVHCKTNTVASVGHAARVGELARFYGIDCPPTWTELKPNDRLVKLRNELVHEARWGDAPIGFSHPIVNESVHLELYWFNSRLLCALLGDRSSYVQSRIVGQPYLME